MKLLWFIFTMKNHFHIILLLSEEENDLIIYIFIKIEKINISKIFKNIKLNFYLLYKNGYGYIYII